MEARAVLRVASSKMVGTVVLESFMQRAILADDKIKILINKVTQLRQKTLSSAIEKEESSLKNENAEIKQDIENLKTKLMVAEIRCGKLQVSMPSSRKPVALQQPVVKAANNDPKGKKIEAAGDAPAAKKVKTEKSRKNVPPANSKPDNIPVDVSRLDFRVGRIVKVERHPNADSLYVEEVETGEEKNRTVVTGIVKFVPIEEMQNRMVVLMMNLKPAKMRGILSQAMVMCACSPEKIEILSPPPGSVPGDRVTFMGYPGEPDPQLNPKKKVWEQIQPELLTDENRVACYRNVPFTVEGKGVVTSQTMAKSSIK